MSISKVKKRYGKTGDKKLTGDKKIGEYPELRSAEEKKDHMEYVINKLKYQN